MLFGSGITENFYTVILKRFFKHTPTSYACLPYEGQCLGEGQTKYTLPYIMDQREKRGFIFQLYKLLEVEAGKDHYTFGTLVSILLSVELPNPYIKD